MRLASVIDEDHRRAREVKAQLKTVDPLIILSNEYHDYANVFFKNLTKFLPPHRSSDHKIQLLKSTTSRHDSLYSMSREELETLHTYLHDNLEIDFIRQSKSSISFSLLFVRKSNEDLRVCVDYRRLNAITIKDRYSIPLIQEILNRMSQSKIFFKLDIISVFHRLRIAEEDK